MEAKGNLCDVFGEEAVAARTFQRWPVKFCLGEFFLKEEPRSRRSSDIGEKVLRSMIRINSTLTSTEVGFKLGIHQNIALDYIKMLSFMPKLSVWVSHELSENNLMDRIFRYVLQILFVTKGNRFWTTW
ncbi:histone-lysine N-methyltransferase SETMAR [Trichonephila clavipes]|nr:histone-lysine N-methyltransferase SETMAR [Trichonephila clavipes]